MLGARRRAFTLVELLLVIGIILVLAALAAAAYPDISLGVRAASGADRLQSWLLNAKMRAKRDGRPTGLRLITFTPTGTFVFCNQMMYVQQPDDYAQGRCTGLTTPATPAGAVQATITGNINASQYGASGTEDLFDVMPGDYFELYGGGPVRQIWTGGSSIVYNAVPNTTTLTFNPNNFPTSPVNGSSSSPGVPTTFATGALPNYRIIRQPRPLPGEPLLNFPEGIGIDLTVYQSSPTTLAYSNPPSRTNMRDPNTGAAIAAYFEILFSPTGAVVGSGSYRFYNDQIFFWVRDLNTFDISADKSIGRPTIIAVQARSGFIAAFPVAPTTVSTDPFFYCKNARSSGM
jgi:prepilin-type N-terminal cleavage/methylation domain-containing protein